jgi:hypothetical protein
MTITEELQFSVLTAPVAALDRRALSQAWYSALYGNGGAAKSVKANAAVPSALTSCAHSATPAAPRAECAGLQRSLQTTTRAAKMPERAQGVPADRRGPRSALARRIERAFLRPRSASKKASFTLDGEHGRVHVLLQSRGSHLKLVAICPPKAQPHVAAALAQARYALAMRGIDLDADTRSATSC